MAVHVNDDLKQPVEMDEKIAEKGDENPALSIDIESNYNVHVFYYPWYGAPPTDKHYMHWNHPRLPHWDAKVAKRYSTDTHVPPDDIGANFYPQLGAYSSRDPKVIHEHMKQIKQTGAGQELSLHLKIKDFFRGLSYDACCQVCWRFLGILQTTQTTMGKRGMISCQRFWTKQMNSS